MNHAANLHTKKDDNVLRAQIIYVLLQKHRNATKIHIRAVTQYQPEIMISVELTKRDPIIYTAWSYKDLIEHLRNI